MVRINFETERQDYDYYKQFQNALVYEKDGVLPIAEIREIEDRKLFTRFHTYVYESQQIHCGKAETVLQNLKDSECWIDIP